MSGVGPTDPLRFRRLTLASCSLPTQVASVLYQEPPLRHQGFLEMPQIGGGLLQYPYLDGHLAFIGYSRVSLVLF
jgi:hypothetical protein